MNDSFLRWVALCLIAVVTFDARAQQTTEFDLRDRAQFDTFVAQMARADVTPATHAAFYQRLESARSATMRGSAPGGSAKLANFVVDIATTDGVSFSATAVSTIEGGSDYTLATLQLFDEDDRPIGPPAKAEQISNGIFVIVKATGTLAPDAPKRTVRAFLSAYIEPRDGSGPIAQNILAAGGVLPQSLQNDAPVARRDPNRIVICVDRWSRQCDYRSARATKFPVKGMVTFSQPIDSIRYGKDGAPVNAGLTLLLANATGGGACQSTTSAGTFFRRYVKIRGKTLAWSINPANFGSCAPRDGRFVAAIGVTVAGMPALISVNDIDAEPSRTTVPIPPISVLGKRDLADH